MKRVLKTGLFFAFALFLFGVGTLFAPPARAQDVTIDVSTFPDANFRQYISDNFDTDNNNILSDAEIAAVTAIDVYNKGISDLTGIGHFTALTTLDCAYNELTTLDVSGNTNLTTLNCSFNSLKALDVSENTALTTLDCTFNPLEALDVSENTALTTLNCYNTKLTSLDVSSCANLTNLDCSNNKLTSLDVTDCANLTDLDCFNTSLTSLDVTGCANLKNLDCSWSSLTSLNIRNCANLTNLDCSNNKLTSLDVTGCASLTDLNCSKNQLTSLNISNCANLTNLDCSNNKLTRLDISDCANLTYLNCSNNELASLKVTGCANLTDLNCSKNQLTSLDVTSCANLTYLNCGSNWLKATLDVSKHTALEELLCYGNEITDLIVNDQLTYLDCAGTKLTSLDLSGHAALQGLYVRSCLDLASLNVSNCASLTSLDISGCTSLNTFAAPAPTPAVAVTQSANGSYWQNLDDLVARWYNVSNVKIVQGVGQLSGDGYDNNIVTWNGGNLVVTYDYAIGNNKTMTVTLTLMAPSAFLPPVQINIPGTTQPEEPAEQPEEVIEQPEEVVEGDDGPGDLEEETPDESLPEDDPVEDPAIDEKIAPPATGDVAQTAPLFFALLLPAVAAVALFKKRRS